jgi:hypothetical protein
MTESALCATCHTLYTEALRPDGTKTGSVLLEQSPYLEWRNSVFTTEGSVVQPDARSCQSCHVPTTDGAGKPIVASIARNPGGFDFPNINERSPYGRHVFVGGNALVPQLIRDLKVELGFPAPKAAFDAVAQAARNQLRSQSLKIQVGPDAEYANGLMRVPVTLRNLTGHKFPSAHPTRRAWIRFVVRDCNGRVLYSSGEHTSEGGLLGADGKLLLSEQLEGDSMPWFPVISTAKQVAILESVMEDDDGKLSFYLLAGARYRKDTSLLPRGWSLDHPEA